MIILVTCMLRLRILISPSIFSSNQCMFDYLKHTVLSFYFINQLEAHFELSEYFLIVLLVYIICYLQRTLRLISALSQSHCSLL